LLGPKLEAVRKSTSDDFVIILRTIIGKTEGMEKAVERANMANDLGVDYVFVDGLNSIEDMEYVSRESRAKLMVNLNENVFPATLDIEKVKSMNFKIGLYPISTLQVAAKSMFEALNLIKEKGTAFEMKNKMTTYSEIIELLHYHEDIEKYSKLYK
ncbi:MAG: PEP phosphonomutase, partial [Sedimentibacter sp.]